MPTSKGENDWSPVKSDEYIQDIKPRVTPSRSDISDIVADEKFSQDNSKRKIDHSTFIPGGASKKG
jgi:hypothetical protein